jgi:hypothetical protein
MQFRGIGIPISPIPQPNHSLHRAPNYQHHCCGSMALSQCDHWRHPESCYARLGEFETSRTSTERCKTKPQHVGGCLRLKLEPPKTKFWPQRFPKTKFWPPKTKFWPPKLDSGHPKLNSGHPKLNSGKHFVCI